MRSKEERQMVNVTLEHLNNDGEWVEKTIELDVDADMSLSDETLDKDMCKLPSLIAYYAELGAELQAQASRKKQILDVAEAKAAQVIREEGKSTENTIKERVLLDDDVQEIKIEYHRAVKLHTMVDGFYRALREKASLAIAICYKQKEEIRVMNSPLN